VGYLSVSQNLLIAIGSVVAPLGIIILPKLSSLISQKREQVIKENINLLTTATFQVFIFIFFQLILFIDALVFFWLGDKFFDAIPIMRITLISTVFYAFFRVMESVLDAVRSKPLNALNLVISTIIFLSSSFFLVYSKVVPPIFALGISFSLSLVALGVLTYISLRRIYHDGIKDDLNHLLLSFSINIPLFLISMAMKPFLSDNILYLILFEILLFSAYLFILWSLKIKWIRRVPENIFYNNE
jgi:O-antigen/teichoic acid export membrane protein